MNFHTFSIQVVSLLIFLNSCTNINPSNLSKNEIAVCDSLNIDINPIKGIKNKTASEIEAFHYSLERMYVNGIEKEINPIYLHGVVFDASTENCQKILASRNLFRDKGYSLFILERNYGINNKKDRMAILNTTDKFEVLKSIKTDGINHNIDNDSLVRKIRKLDEKYDLDLIGAGGDWCEFIIGNKNINWSNLAKEAYKFCPDIVNQGTETIESLEKELKRTGRLYFWWD